MTNKEWKLRLVSNRVRKVFQGQERNEYVFQCQIRNNLKLLTHTYMVQHTGLRVYINIHNKAITV
jgi:hypothetical protein